MPGQLLPVWTMLPFAVLVLSMAALPAWAPHAWERGWGRALVVGSCSVPLAAYLALSGFQEAVLHSASSYLTFIATLTALFVTSSGVHVTVGIEATPRTNLLWLGLGALLASCIGTTGASMLLIRPFLHSNSGRERTRHLVPFFILTVANSGGLLTPIGDPPLLMGFLDGVPFFWTLRLLPVWVLYVGWFLGAFYVIDRRAYDRESPRAGPKKHSALARFEIRGRHNIAWLLAVVPSVFLPVGWREACLLSLSAGSLLSTTRELRMRNAFSFEPLLEVALVFAGLFVCLVPIESGLSARAAALPIASSWQLFWVSGGLSAVLDNAPTYAAFAALARGLSSSTAALVAGIEPLKLAAISTATVVMGAMTYIGNVPNLMVKTIAERAGYELPSFSRYLLFAFALLLPPSALWSTALFLLER